MQIDVYLFIFFIEGSRNNLVKKCKCSLFHGSGVTGLTWDCNRALSGETGPSHHHVVLPVLTFLPF